MVVGEHRGVGEETSAVEGLDLDRHDGEVGLPSAQVTSINRSGCLRRAATFGQSVRCTLTPWPFVTNPRISSPGTGYSSG